jgi:hypothetical protein
MSRIKSREVFKFLSGVPFLGYTISPELLGARAVAQFVLFVVFFYLRSRRLSRDSERRGAGDVACPRLSDVTLNAIREGECSAADCRV